jgi:hypothetical protein
MSLSKRILDTDRVLSSRIHVEDLLTKDPCLYMVSNVKVLVIGSIINDPRY